MPAPGTSPATAWPACDARRPGQRAGTFFEFFAATIPNANTRDSYVRDIIRFLTRCEQRHFDPMAVTSIHLAGYREDLRSELAPPSVKQHFSSLPTLYAWWVEKGVLERNLIR